MGKKNSGPGKWGKVETKLSRWERIKESLDRRRLPDWFVRTSSRRYIVVGLEDRMKRIRKAHRLVSHDGAFHPPERIVPLPPETVSFERARSILSSLFR